MKRLFLLLLALPLSAQIPAGFVQTTGTVSALANGTFGAAWTNQSSSSQLPLLGCVSAFQQTVNGNLDGSGHFSVLLADTAQICPNPSTWTFTFTYNCPPTNTGFVVAVPVTGGGTTEDISAQITAALPTNPCSGGSPGGGGRPAPPSFAVQFANNGASSFATDPSITINPATHQLNLSTAANLATGLQAPTANAAVTVASVLAYGAKGDRQLKNASGTFLTAQMSSSGTTLTGGTTTFTAADVGKYVMIYGASAQPFATVAYVPGSLTWVPNNVAKIISFTDATHVVLDRPALNSFTSFLTYGTDNTPFFAACANAVMSSPAGGGNCQVPQGVYIFATAPYYTTPGAYDYGDYGFATAGGSGATGTCTISGGQITGCTVSNGGSGYTDNSAIPTTFSGGCPVAGLPNFTSCAAQEAFGLANTNSSGVVTSFTIVLPGFGFTSPPTPVVGQLGGDGAAATVTISGGAINGNTVTAGGSGYVASGTTGVIAIGGTCNLLAQSTGAAPSVAIGNIATTAGGAVTGTITWTTNATGCVTPPTVIFGGGAACNTGTAASPTYVQCTNLTALSPIPWPTSVWVPQGVSFVGTATKTNQASQLAGVWDGATVDNNQATLMGGTLAHSDILNLTFGTAMIGVVGDNNTNYGAVDNLIFNTGIGMVTQSTDLNFSCSDLQFQGNASWVSGGAWRHRLNYPLGAGGIFDGFGCSNMIVRLTAHNALTDTIDTWFANNVWRPEFSGASPDMPGGQGCTYPQTLNQRQTSRVAVQNINNFCYEGITGAGMTILDRDGRGTGGAIFSNTVVKSGFRANFYGSLGGGQLIGMSCEGCTHLSSDPYRAGSALEGSIIIDETGTGGQFSISGVGYTGTGVSYCLYSVTAGGAPTSTGWNGIACAGGVTNTEASLKPYYPVPIDFPAGSSIGKQVFGGSVFGLDLYGRTGGVSNALGARLEWLTNGATFLASDLATQLFDVQTSVVTAHVPLNGVAGFKYNGAAASGHCLVGNGTAYVDSASCASSSPSAFTAVTITSHAGTLATAGAAFTNGTVALDHTSTTTINVSGLASGAYFNLRLNQDSSGANTLTMGTGCTWLVGSGSGFVPSTTPTLTAAANGVNVLSAVFDGSSCMYNIR